MGDSRSPMLPPPTGTTSDFVDASSFASASIVLAALWLTLSTVFFVGRMYSKIHITYSVGHDDWACFIAWLFAIVYAVLVTQLSPIMRHSWDIPMTSYSNDIAIRIYVTDLMGAMAMLFPKLSLFLLYRRLFSPNRNTKRLIYYGIIVSLATYWTFIPLETYYCTPRGNQQWNAIEVSEKCSKIRPYTIVQGAINVLLDVYILYLPIPVVWKLQLSTPQKAGVLFVFMHGIMAVAAGILALCYKARLYQPDSFWNNSFVYVITIVESNVTIICSCMPAFSPIFKYHYALANFFTSIPTHAAKSWARTSSNNINNNDSWLFRKFRSAPHKPAWHEMDRQEHDHHLRRPGTTTTTTTTIKTDRNPESTPHSAESKTFVDGTNTSSAGGTVVVEILDLGGRTRGDDLD